MNTAAAEQPVVEIPAVPGIQTEAGFYVGRVRGFNGEPAADIFLLPGEFEGTYQEAMDWAAEQGGVLPDRREGALIFANGHDQMKQDWHWLREPSEGDDAYAWCQGFNYGDQGWLDRSDKLYARAVRRFSVI